MWHWWCLSWLKMIVLLNNKREEIDRAVFYCVSQNVNLVENKISPIDKKSGTVSTLRQSPCSSLVTFVPCPRKRVFVASSAFLELFCHIMFKLHLLYQAFKLFRLGNLPHRFPVAEFFSINSSLQILRKLWHHFLVGWCFLFTWQGYGSRCSSWLPGNLL